MTFKRDEWLKDFEEENRRLAEWLEPQLSEFEFIQFRLADAEDYAEQLIAEAKAQSSKLARAESLMEKWRSKPSFGNGCANDLEQALRGDL
jgi:uncharacterized Rmd1/YagE family protein